MSRRPSLPGADELFRRTSSPESGSSTPLQAVPSLPASQAATGSPSSPSLDDPRTEGEARAAGPGADSEVAVAPKATPARSVHRPARRRSRGNDKHPTGREMHEEKITVYVSPEELIDLESAKLALRGKHGLAVDRGRIVREAVAVVLADLEAKGEESILVRRLRGL